MGDAEAMAKAIAILLADPLLAETMRRRGREGIIQRFTIEQVVKPVMDVHEPVAHG